MMKTLWLGCSHSCGFYAKGNKQLVDKRLGLIGMPVHVSREWDWNDWKIISAPGNGLLEFAVMLSDMDKNNILDFQNIIIQLTNEPRLISFNRYGETLKLEYMRRYILCNNEERHEPFYRYDSDYTHPHEFKLQFNMHPITFYDLFKDKNWSSTNDKKILLEVAEEINQSLGNNLKHLLPVAFDSIIEIIKRRNINLYLFHWYESKGTYNYLRKESYIDYDIFDGKGIWDICSQEQRNKMYVENTKHPTRFGSEHGSKLIIQALKQKCFKG